MQKLSKRLQAAADFVSEGNRTADIGTDHGFLPIYLIQSGKCPQAIAMDIRKGPLERAREHIAAAGLGGLIQTRLSDGMQALERGEADSAVITGMGGQTVIHILEEAREILPDLKELVLEPQSDTAKVRRYLREHKMEIDREALVQEAGKFYPVLHVDLAKQMQKEPIQRLRAQPSVSVVETNRQLNREEPGNKRKNEIPLRYEEPENGCQMYEGLRRDTESENEHQMYEGLLHRLGDRERVQEVLDQYGACLVYGRHPLLRQMLEREEERALGILQALASGHLAADGKEEHTDAVQVCRQQSECRQEQPDAAQMRRQQVERRLEEIRALLQML